MTDPNTVPAAHPARQAVEARFLTRPTLRSVTAQLLADHLKEKYPPLRSALADLRLAIPRDGGGRSLLPLLEVALSHLADGSFPDVSMRYGLDCYLGDATGTRLSFEADGPHDYDLAVIEAVIRELPLILSIAFQDALAAYWNQDTEAGGSRWQWLARVLHGALLDSAIRQPGSLARQLDTLLTLARYPERSTRAQRPWPQKAVRAYTLETVLEQAGSRLTLQASDVLVVAPTQVLLCRVSGQIEAYADLEAFGQAWGMHLQQRFRAQRITWKQYEPDGNIFEVQAALILEGQLDTLAAIELPAGSSVQALELRFAAATNPAQVFSPSTTTPLATLNSIRAALPAWLQHAGAAERLAYRECLLEQAGIRRLTLGDSDFDSLETLRSYATEHLNHQLCLDRSVALGGQRACDAAARSSGYHADDLQLTFHVAVGTLAGGYVEPVTLSLVDLALKNLSGAPNGRMTLSHRTGRAIEAWLTADGIRQLVQRVDIGKNYPLYLRQELLGDTEAAQKRKRLFEQQRPVQLKTQALEHRLKGEAGLTPRGILWVNAVLSPACSGRQVDGESIVMRVLALVRKPGATADVVQNMFIIEPLDTQRGPHLLYRPAYRDSLLEFASRDSLLAALVRPGALQDSVLTWLPDSARAIYSNGGFTQPHYVRVGLGSEFDPLPRVPEPAQLAAAGDQSSDEILQALNNGSLMEYLFGCETRQLLAQAERESTSNSESRWALILEGMQLGFNTLLMAVRGPLAAIGWLMQLVQGLTHDVPALESDDPQTQALAWVDLLQNIALLLVHHGSLTAAPVHPVLDEALPMFPALRRAALGAATSQPAIERGTVGLPCEPPGGGRTLVDFDHSLASDAASAALLEKLRAFSLPWPQPLPAQVSAGRHLGLYNLNGVWHASVGGLLFRASIVPGFGDVYIVHPEKTDHPGIKLRTDGKGHWTLDRGLKLVGGGPKRMAALREENQRRKNALLARGQALNTQITHLMAPFLASMEQMLSAATALKNQRKTVQLVWNLLQKATPEQQPALTARHQQETLNHQQRRTEFQILLQNLEDQFAQSLPPRLEMVKVGQELERVGGAGVHVHDRAKILGTLWNQQSAIQTLLLDRLNAMRFSSAGEPMAQMARRMFVDNLLGDTTVYDEYIRNTVESANIREHMAEVAAVMEHTLEQLEQDSVAGRVIRQECLTQIQYPQNFFANNLRLNALNYLAAASVATADRRLPPQEDFYLNRLEQSDLAQALQSHVEVRSGAEYPLAEQRNVYETVLDRYRRHEDAIRALKALNPGRLRPEAERLLTGLEFAQALAQSELEAVVRKQEELDVVLPLSKTLRPKNPAKRVFKTRKKAYLIGELKPADAQNSQEQLTLTDALTGETIASFSQHADGWATTAKDPAAAPAGAAQVRSLATLKGLAQALIEQRKGIEQLITAEQQKLDSPLTRQHVDPGDWNEMLMGHAGKLTALADELARDHLTQKTAVQRLIDEYRAHARDISRLAQRVCSAAYKRQWPTQESLNYLWEQKQIDINLTSLADPQRPTLSGDFFTEYAVYDKAKKPPVVLWYAHFHYAHADALPAHYTRAHLKLPEQRKYTQKDLLKQRVQADLQTRTEPGADPLTHILYVLITPPVDQLFLAIAPVPRAPR
ncbi:hypothetical protein [Pseudomonas sp. MF6747]|uniref:hypothetical protein n=1 Tax=Pseudomonas sp. MF6747 TaxID=2797527 RepID=UPI00190D3BCB|nr:hypothetical protein [Pseudomonas sp. MF6747]MBK3507260.1 hypothetical protein [Pseudomonas sp. MF6747]